MIRTIFGRATAPGPAAEAGGASPANIPMMMNAASAMKEFLENIIRNIISLDRNE
jgi:hypothetical protein